MNYCEIKKTDIANGSGVRVTLFVSGCRHHCKGCFQPDTWNFDYGKPFTDTTADEILNALSKGYIKGLTLLDWRLRLLQLRNNTQCKMSLSTTYAGSFL